MSSHGLKRLQLHFFPDAGPADIVAITALVRGGRALMLRRQDNGYKRWLVDYRGRRILAICDEQFSIVTVFVHPTDPHYTPPEQVMKGKRLRIMRSRARRRRRDDLAGAVA